MITCMKMKSFILKYASKIMFYDINIACYQTYKLSKYQFSPIKKLSHQPSGCQATPCALGDIEYIKTP